MQVVTHIISYTRSYYLLPLIYILWLGTFERGRIKEIIKRDFKAVTDEFDRNDTRIAAGAIYDIFERRRWDSSFPGQ